MNKVIFGTVAGIIITGVIIFLVVAMITPRTETYTVLGHDLELLEAKTQPQKIQGLSGVALEDLGADGMVFLYENKKIRDFWMRGMEFDLDVVWIRDGRVVDIDRNLSAPEKGEDVVRMSSSPFEVDTVLELPAGMAHAYGIQIGHTMPAFE